ncbi:MAG: hypothetical protein JRE64_26020 [Deltaproteobacteria bacterium]|nr:hypothetical protein [Deltaproteobacteria bacterium]
MATFCLQNFLLIMSVIVAAGLQSTEVSEEEQENLYHEIIQHKETAMLAQYIRDKGMQQGMQQVLTERFGSVSGELSRQIKRIDSRERLKDLLRQALRVKNFNEFGKKVVNN